MYDVKNQPTVILKDVKISLKDKQLGCVYGKCTGTYDTLYFFYVSYFPSHLSN